VPYVATHIPNEVSPGRLLLAEGPKFVLERWSRAGSAPLVTGGQPVWLVPMSGGGTIDGAPLEAGGVWLVDSDVPLALEDGIDMIVAYAGGTMIAAPWAA